MDNLCYLVGENGFDIALLKKVIPNTLRNKIKFFEASGYGSALSKAKSLAIRLDTPVVLVLNSDTTSKEKLAEKIELVEFIFDGLGKSEQVSIFFFHPNMQAVFAESRESAKQLGYSVNDSLALSQLNEQDCELLRQLPTVQRIIEGCEQALRAAVA